MNSLDEVFDKVKKALEMPEDGKESFIYPLRILEFTGTQAALYLKDKWTADFVAEKFGEKLKKAWQEVLGLDVETLIYNEIDCPERFRKDLFLHKETAVPELQDDIAMLNKLSDAEIRSNYKYNFENFIVAENNKLAFTACRKIADGDLGKINPLYIYSEPGLGKTHLLTAVKIEMERKYPNLNVVMTTADKFLKDFVASLERFKSADEKMMEYYRKADMLLMDDVQFLSGKKETQQKMFEVFNSLHEKGRQIILTSDRPPKEINDIEKRLLTRFEWGLLADIGSPEIETRIRIVKRKADLLDFKIPDKVVNFIAEKVKYNIRSLEGVILKMHATSEMTGNPPTLVMAQQVIKDYISEATSSPITVEKILSEISDVFGVTIQDMRGVGRNAKISTARQSAIYIMHKITSLNYTSIGREMGNRDHSTIVYAISKVTETMAKDSGYKAKIEDTLKILQG